MSSSDTRGDINSSLISPTPIAPNAAIWVIAIGAFFGLITLLGLFAFAYLASTNTRLCTSFQFQLLAGGFALGAALAGSFIGGGAGAQGNTGSAGFNLAFGLTGGAALLIVTLTVFSFFAPKGCDLVGSEQLQTKLDQVTAELTTANGSFNKAHADLVMAISERDSALSDKISSRAMIKGLVAAIQNAFPDAGNLSVKVSNISDLVAQSCPGGAHGIDPLNAGQIRVISEDAARRISSAQSAIANIIASVPAELKQ